MTHAGNGALQHYRKVGAQGGVESSDPHQLIVLLMHGALDAIASAKGHIERGELGPKGASISRALEIIEGLRTSLDHSVESEMVTNLDELYRYMARRLLQANIQNDRAPLDEVGGLLREIREAWQSIPQEMRVRTATDSPPETAAG